MAVNEKRSWFWKKIGFWFVPARSEKLGPEEWAKVLKRSQPAKRRMRRLLTLSWLPVLAFEIAVSLRVVRLDPWAGLMSAALLTMVMGLAVRALRIGFAQVSLEDRAVMEHGAEFDALKETQRGEIFQRAVRDGLSRPGEGGRARRPSSSGCGPGGRLPVAGARAASVCRGYWSVCLFGPFEATRSALAVTAVVVTWLAAAGACGADHDPHVDTA